MEHRVDTFDGQTIIVTGAAAGIGRGVAEALVSRGANVVLLDISADAVELLAKELTDQGRTAVAAPADATVFSEVEGVVERTVQQFGRVDGLVIAAGGFPGRTPVQEIGLEDWDRGITLNLTSAFYACRAVIPYMQAQQKGAIVMVSSAAGRTIVNQCTAYYAAAKAGMLGLARHLAFELGPHNIRVNSVAPGTTITPRILGLYDEERLDTIRAKTPLGRIAEIDDQVGPILFLLSDDSGYMTGSALDVSGGRIMM
jgi:3-oxoacyl-[acyl-carrier protein] reductase